MSDQETYSRMIKHLQNAEVLAQDLAHRHPGRTYFINADIISEVIGVYHSDGKIQAIKYLRQSLQPFTLLPLRDCKRMVEQAVEGTIVEHTRGYSPPYRIFRGI